MFTSKGKGPEMPAAPDPTQKRSSPSRIMTSIIANGVRIQGSILAEGAEIQIDGEIEGDVRGGALTVGETGYVKGDVVSESVIVNGRVEGTVRSRKVTLARTAHVMGDITHQQLSVEMGAVFEGQCRYVQDPLKGDGVAAMGQLTGPSSASSSSSSSTSAYGESSDRDSVIGGVVITGAQ